MQAGRVVFTQVEDDIVRDYWGTETPFIQDKLHKRQTKPFNTTSKHNTQVHIGPWALRPGTGPKTSSVRAQMCNT